MDITLGVFVQIVFTLLGLALIVSATGHQGFVRPTLIGAVIGVLAIIGFYVVQRLGMFRFIGKMISRLANADDWHSLVHSGQTLDEAIRRLYARRRGVIGCCMWTATSLIFGSGEIWIALHALGLASDARQRGHSSEHGSDDPVGNVPRAGRPRRAGGRLRSRW